MINVAVKYYHNRHLPVCYYVVQSPTCKLWNGVKSRWDTHINVKLTWCRSGQFIMKNKMYVVSLLTIFSEWTTLKLPNRHGSDGSASVSHYAAHSIIGSSPTNACIHMHKYVDQKAWLPCWPWWCHIEINLEDSIAHRQWRIQVRDPFWPWNPG